MEKFEVKAMERDPVGYSVFVSILNVLSGDRDVDEIEMHISQYSLEYPNAPILVDFILRNQLEGCVSTNLNKQQLQSLIIAMRKVVAEIDKYEEYLLKRGIE